MYRKYKSKDFADDQPTIELAYALTVHKAQGSEFGKVILVIPRDSFNLSRELIYTALTRQKEGIVIIYQGNPIDLMEYNEEKWSETNRRFTNLFQAPNPQSANFKDRKDIFLEDRLINRTLRGEDVRSKSELIIANLLYHNDIEYEYEGVLEFNGEVRRPDFVIDGKDTIYYWEHLGMLNNPKYKQGWERKKEWYKKNGIDEDGGENGTLIISEDNPKGGISSQDIEEKIKKIIV